MKFRFSAIVLALSMAASAQTTFSLQNHDASMPITAGSSIYGQVLAEETHKVNIDITNISGSAHTYKVKRYDVLLNSNGTDEAVAFFCFGGGCYTPEVTTSIDQITLQPGEKSSTLSGDFQMLLAELTEISTSGLSHVKYTFYNIASTNDTIQFSIRYNDPSAGLNGNSSLTTNFSLAPNPANSSANVHMSLAHGAKCSISVYNLLGALVSTAEHNLEAGKNLVPIQIEGLKIGLYFVSLSAGNHTAVRRLIIN